MSIYYRYKKKADGFRKLVELFESTPMSRRQKMIDVGMIEDPDYTIRILQYVLTFQDVIDLPDMELTEVLAAAPPRFIGYAIYSSSKEIKTRFLSRSQPKMLEEIKEALEMPELSKMDMSAGQRKLVEITRAMEKRGYVKTKRIPPGL